MSHQEEDLFYGGEVYSEEVVDYSRKEAVWHLADVLKSAKRESMTLKESEEGDYLLEANRPFVIYQGEPVNAPGKTSVLDRHYVAIMLVLDINGKAHLQARIMMSEGKTVGISTLYHGRSLEEAVKAADEEYRACKARFDATEEDIETLVVYFLEQAGAR